MYKSLGTVIVTGGTQNIGKASTLTLADSGYDIILIGHKNHPEVIGTMGQLPKGSIDLIQNEDEAKKYKLKNDKKCQRKFKANRKRNTNNIIFSKF